jgi:hypothetical protein
MDALGELLRANYGKIDPNEIYDSDGSKTFVIDKEKNKLYSEDYPTTHEDLLWRLPGHKTSKSRDSSWGRIDPNLILGRLGYIPYDLPKKLIYLFNDRSWETRDTTRIPAISFWNHFITSEDVDLTINLLKKKHPSFFKGGFAVFGDKGNGPEFRYFPGGEQQQGEEPEPCKKLNTIQIQGKPFSLPQIVSQLHMSKGQELSYLKAGFCAQYPILKNTSEKTGCTQQTKILDFISSKFQCGQSDYQSALQAGRLQYRQKLKDIFSKPENIGKEFKTQKEIDQAWDELMHGKKAYENFSFKEWLKTIS